MKHPFQFLQEIKKGKLTRATFGFITIRSEKSLSLIIARAGPERDLMNFLKISKEHFRLTGTKATVKLSPETNLNILHAWIMCEDVLKKHLAMTRNVRSMLGIIRVVPA